MKSAEDQYKQKNRYETTCNKLSGAINYRNASDECFDPTNHCTTCLINICLTENPDLTLIGLRKAIQEKRSAVSTNGIAP